MLLKWKWKQLRKTFSVLYSYYGHWSTRLHESVCCEAAASKQFKRKTNCNAKWQFCIFTCIYDRIYKISKSQNSHVLTHAIRASMCFTKLAHLSIRNEIERLHFQILWWCDFPLSLSLSLILCTVNEWKSLFTTYYKSYAYTYLYKCTHMIVCIV